MSNPVTMAVREVILARSGSCCEVCSIGAVEQIHHRMPRGMGGTKAEIHSPSWLLGLCAACHRMVESDRLRAYDRGWLIHRGWSMRNDVSAADVPVIWQGDWALLSDDGNVFTPPQGRDRCARCGFHVPTQGHRQGCQVMA